MSRKKYTCGTCKKKRNRLPKSIVEIDGVKYCRECEPSPALVGSQEPRKPGRPKGSKTISDSVLVVRGECQGCGSTDRKVLHRRTRAISGVFMARPYTRVTWTRCQCRRCGRTRVEKSFEN